MIRLWRSHKLINIDQTCWLWATYYGGSTTSGFGIATDTSGYVYITGSTYSTTGIATPGAYQTIMSGTSDAFLAKFNAAGAFNGLLIMAATTMLPGMM